jgi:hypothetical protein
MADIDIVTPLVEDEVKQESERGAETEQTAAGAETEAEAPADTGEVSVTIGDERPPEEEKAPAWVREVRQRNRELERELKELRRAQQTATVSAVGTKPTLADFDYDEDKFTAALDAWHAKKRAADAEQEKIEKQHAAEQQAWTGKLATYGELKNALKVPDFDEVEATVQETLSERQQAIIVKGAKNPALVVLALGKNPGKLKELADISDLVEFAFAVANVESQLKVTKRPTPPAPERKVNGDASLSGANDDALAKARAQAEKTGDLTEVMRIKRERAKKAA